MEAVQLIALNLRRLRIPAGLSQEDLALAAGVDRTYLSKIERCLDNPTVAVLERLAIALDVPIHELLLPIKSIAEIPQRSKGGRPRTRPVAKMNPQRPPK